MPNRKSTRFLETAKKITRNLQLINKLPQKSAQERLFVDKTTKGGFSKDSFRIRLKINL